MKKISIILLGIFIVVGGFTAVVAEEDHDSHHHETMMPSGEGMVTGTAPSVSNEEGSKADYTCSMCPDVKADEPGNCPQCGMALEKKTEAGWSATSSGQVAGSAVSEDIVNIGNAICPATGEFIADVGDGKGVQIEHEGRIYNVCCKFCAKDFKKDPEKFIKIIENNLAEGEDPGRDYNRDHDEEISEKNEGSHHDHSGHGH